ncbi:hypothetical protein B0H14DRAFT_3108224 [Mycena olivaceomarginata]|nr:hypothetical protein B0H14DRAFT_3108224 [Mycena olivaceomarginata]
MQQKVAVSFYIVAALVMVLGNKAVLNQTPDLPFTFLSIQLSTAVLLFPTVLDRSTATKLLPFLSVGFIGLVFNTLCLANVDASFFQIARGLLLPFTILMSSLFTRTIPRLHVFLSALVVTLGFLVGVAPSFSLTSNSTIAREPLRAVLYGLISSIVLSMHVVLSKVVTATVKHSVIGISYFGNLFMAVGLIPFIFLNGELDALHRHLVSPDQVWTTFVVGTAVTGVFGFLLGIANVLSIKVTSPVSHMFSAVRILYLAFLSYSPVLNQVLQAAKSAFFSSGTLSQTYRLGAITLITGGTMFYTWIQSNACPATSAPKNDLEQQNENVELEQPLLQEKMDEKAGTMQ